MNIVFLAHHSHPRIGGVEKHIESVSKVLLKKGHKVDVISEQTGITVLNIKLVGLVLIWVQMLFSIGSFLKADIVHIHDVLIWYLPIRIVLFWKPVYMTFHGWEENYPISKNSLYQKKLANMLSKKSLAIGDYISAFYGVKADIVSYGATNIKYANTKKDKDLVYVGRLGAKTALPFYLKTAKKLKRLDIEFCGDGELKKECTAQGTVHGLTDPEPFLASAKITLASGYLTVIEAMASKSRVVVPCETQARKKIFCNTPFSKWTIIGKSPDKLAKSIKSEAKNPNIDAIESAYRWAKTQTWEKMAGNYMKLWQ